MFTNRLRLVLTLSAIFVTVPWIANAGVVSLSYRGYNMTNDDGTIAIDPYYGKINNGPTICIWCVDYSHPVMTNTWTVNATSTAGVNFDHTYLNNQTEYREIVWLINYFQTLKSDPYDPSTATPEQLECQYAIWSFSMGPHLDATGQEDVTSAYKAVLGGYNPRGWTILTDTGGSNQEFIVEEQVPEPSLMVLMLIGVSAVCVYCYRTGRS